MKTINKFIALLVIINSGTHYEMNAMDAKSKNYIIKNRGRLFNSDELKEIDNVLELGTAEGNITSDIELFRNASPNLQKKMIKIKPELRDQQLKRDTDFKPSDKKDPNYIIENRFTLFNDADLKEINKVIYEDNIQTDVELFNKLSPRLRDQLALFKPSLQPGQDWEF